MEKIISVLNERKKTPIRLTRNSKLFKTIINGIKDKKGDAIVSLDLKKIDEAVGLKLTAELESQPNNIEVMLNQYAESLLSNISKERSNEYKNIVTSRRGSAAGQDEEPTSTPAPG